MNTKNTVAVWDILIRIFHWFLVIAFTVAYVSSEEGNAWHIYAGYTVLGLIVFRLIWGLIGSRYARFSDFVKSPAAVCQYVTALRAGNAPHYLGHNPLGGWMVIALLGTLLVVTVSGLKLYAVEEGSGPLAASSRVFSAISVAKADDGNDDQKKSSDENPEEEFWEDLHEGASNLMLILIALHVLGVVVSSKMHGESLVKAMFTGKKPQK